MPAYPDPNQLEEQAQYQPGIGSKLLNLATGGFFGALSGQTERAQKGAMARQILLQENLRERELDRAMKRKVQEFAVQEGLDPNQIQGTSGVEMMRSLYPIMESKRIQSLRDQIRGMTNQEPAKGLSADELQGQLNRIKTVINQDESERRLSERAGATGKLLQGMGVVPTPFNIEGMTPAQKIALESVYVPKYQSGLIFERQQQPQLQEKKAFEQWNTVLNDPKYTSQTGDLKDQIALNEERRNELAKIYPDLPKEFQKDPGFRNQAGLMREMKQGDQKILQSRTQFYKDGIKLASAISDLVGEKDYNVISQMNFNELQAWRNGLSKKYLQQNPKMAQVDRVLQAFENLVMGQRKTLFGVTLSKGEQQSADRAFGSPTQANFLNNAINFMDSIYDPKFVGDTFTDLGIFVPSAYSDNLLQLGDEYGQIRNKFSSPSLQGKPVSVTPVPSTTSNTYKQIEKEVSDVDARINALKAQR